jgi:hypothetical protein
MRVRVRVRVRARARVRARVRYDNVKPSFTLPPQRLPAKNTHMPIANKVSGEDTSSENSTISQYAGEDCKSKGRLIAMLAFPQTNYFPLNWFLAVCADEYLKVTLYGQSG